MGLALAPRSDDEVLVFADKEKPLIAILGVKDPDADAEAEGGSSLDCAMVVVARTTGVN